MGDTGASTDGVILGMDWGKFNKSLEKGREFEDYVSECLWGLGLAVMTYGSMRYQRKGESLNGIEIKYEGKFRETKRLYIECRQEKKDWEVSGIFKRDNTWLWVMGDYKGFYIFTKVDLQMMHGSEDGLWQTEIFNEANTTNTSGYLLPVEVADYMCVDYVGVGSKSLGEYGMRRDYGKTRLVRGKIARGENPIWDLGLDHRNKELGFGDRGGIGNGNERRQRS